MFVSFKQGVQIEFANKAVLVEIIDVECHLKKNLSSVVQERLDLVNELVVVIVSAEVKELHDSLSDVPFVSLAQVGS